MARVRFPDLASNVGRVSLLCTERFSPGTPVSPLLKNQHMTLFVLIINFSLQCPYAISAPALERLDTLSSFFFPGLFS